MLEGASAAGVADISPTDAYAVGNSAATAAGSLVHWNGTAWSPVTLPLPAGANSNTTLNAMSADGPDDVWIVGTFLDSANGQNQTFGECSAAAPAIRARLAAHLGGVPGRWW